MFVKVVCGPAYVFYFATTRGVEDGVALLQLGCPFLSVLVLLEHFRSFWTAEQSSSVLLQRKKDSISRVKSSEASATAYPNFFFRKKKGPRKGMKKRNWVLSSQSEISSPSPGTTPLGTTRPSQQACATHQSGVELPPSWLFRQEVKGWPPFDQQMQWHGESRHRISSTVATADELDHRRKVSTCLLQLAEEPPPW